MLTPSERALCPELLRVRRPQRGQVEGGLCTSPQCFKPPGPGSGWASPLCRRNIGVTSYVFLKYITCISTAVPSCTRRPAGEMLVRGSEDGHEAAGPAGAPRGPGLSPVNKHHPEGLIREETRRSNKTSWTLPVLTCQTVWGKDPTASLHTGLRWTGGTKAKPLSQVL